MEKTTKNNECKKIVDTQAYEDLVKKLICARIKTKAGTFKHTHLIKKWKKSIKEFKIRRVV